MDMFGFLGNVMSVEVMATGRFCGVQGGFVHTGRGCTGPNMLAEI